MKIILHVEKEELLFNTYLEKRKNIVISEGSYVRFDILLTLNHDQASLDLFYNGIQTCSFLWEIMSKY